MLAAMVPLRNLLKAVLILSVPPLLVLAIFVFSGILDLSYFLYAYTAILMGSAVMVRPFLASISGLARYVNGLAEDKKVEAPDLSVLGIVEELSVAVGHLHQSWEKKKQQLENSITEREILVDTLPDILVMIDDEMRVLRTNRAARDIFGQNLAHKPLKEVIDSQTLIIATGAVIEDRKGREIEFTITEPKEIHFRALIERFPVPTLKGISTIITLNDVTELKRAEQMRADFVANASHEIRTPLASLVGFIETLQGPAKDDAQARDEFLKIMAEQTERMSRLVRDLLSLSKIEMHAGFQPVGKVEMVALIRNEYKQFDWAADKKGIKILLDLQHSLPPVRGEEGEIAQVIHNLIGNAIKYGHENSEIRVIARVTTKLPSSPFFRHVNMAVMVAVQDQGEGIPAEHIPRLTERFYRVDSARSRKVGGTGLGLAIVQHILNRHRGWLTIDSEVGKGSVFTIYLPIYEELHSN